MSGRSFLVDEAYDRGLSRRRLAASDLEIPFRAVRTARGSTTPNTLEDRNSALLALARAYSLRAGGDEVFSHVTAARLWGIALPWRLESRPGLDVSVYEPAFPPQIAGVIGHRIARDVGAVERFSLPCAPVIETWVQLATVLSVDELVAAGDSIVRRKMPLATLDEVLGAAQAARRRPGIRKLRAAARLVRSGTDSPGETRMRLVLVRAGLPEPLIGFTVHDERHAFVGTPDLAYPDARIALDYEGEIHRVDPRTFAQDITRREAFQDARWRHIRVVKEHLDRPLLLLSRVTSALANPALR